MKTHLDRGARLTLAIAALMLAWGAVGTLYYFSLPTQVWLVSSPVLRLGMSDWTGSE